MIFILVVNLTLRLSDSKWSAVLERVSSQVETQGMKQYAVELDGIVLLIFVMYNVLSAGGYLAKKIGRARNPHVACTKSL